MPTIRDFEHHLSGKLSELYAQQEAKSIAQLSLMHVLNVNKIQLSMNGLKELSIKEISSLEMLLNELMTGRPLQYVLGETEFYGYPIKVNENVLIPRPETEELVHWILADYKQKATHELSVLDICTGSGCIPISLKKNLPDAKVSGLDISFGALEVAMQNAVLNNVEVRFYQQDILKNSISNEPCFDIIVSNPPYVRHTEKELMHKNVLDFEPHLALFVEDNDPLTFYKKIANDAAKALKAGGSLYFEINEAFGNEVKTLMEEAGFSQVEIKKDLYDKDRMARGVLF